MIGTKLAHYEITCHLGTGGMGEVYQASDSRLGRSVAGRKVYVEPFPATGAKFLITKDGGNHPVWSPDGRKLIFMDDLNNGQLYSVAIATQPSFTFGNPVALPIKGFLQRVGSWRDYDISPDGKQFLVVLLPGTASSDAPQALQIQVVLNWFEELKQRMSSH